MSNEFPFSVLLPPATDPSVLSSRQWEILELLLEGFSEKEIAHELFISQHTVHLYAKCLYRVFDVHSRGELLGLWIKHMTPQLKRTIAQKLAGRIAAEQKQPLPLPGDQCS